MKLQDLKPGMLVKLRNGKVFLVVPGTNGVRGIRGGRNISDSSWMDFSSKNYSDDMYYTAHIKLDREYDIVGVRTCNGIWSMDLTRHYNDAETIEWERTEIETEVDGIKITSDGNTFTIDGHTFPISVLNHLVAIA